MMMVRVVIVMTIMIVHVPKRGYDVNDMRLVGKILGLFLSKGVDAVAERQQRSVDGGTLLQTQPRVLVI